ncbi:MAG: glycosyltransferase family 39 protein [Deltaproteobacteria bacterium]|nr:glycosyltransferase family 39 protein [Deltaproteobacteria bacterium]
MAPGEPARRTDSVLLVVILLVSAWLRLASLSYSHFQGDEVKALYPPDAPFPAFLLAQRKAPLQFLVTRASHAVSGGFDEGRTRLPFALASLLAVLVLYRLVLCEFGRFPALLSAALLGGCGLLVAFARTVQYQSFLVLFVLLTAWLALDWLRRGRSSALYLAALAYGLALLTHYDALVFAPALGLIAWLGYRHHAAARRPLLRAAAIAGGLAALFYVPFVLQPEFRSVRLYLQARVAAGNGLAPFGAVADLLALYLPPGWLLVALPLLVIGLVRVLRRPRHAAGVVVGVWFLTSFAFYLLLGGDPRSHVYACFPPGLILIALGIDALIGQVRPLAAAGAVRAATWLLLAAAAAATHWMLVDHRIEHPWAAKTLLGYRLPNLAEREMEGVFGFPYRRGLEQVGALFAAGVLRGSYASNERDVVTDFYFQAPRAATPDYYVYVHRPLSLQRGLPADIAATYQRRRVIEVAGAPAIEIYAAPSR